MRPERRDKRKAEIEDIAYDIIENQGIEGLTMASLAKQAKASMETLYSWYGDKNGVYSALVARNSKDVLTVLEQADASGGAPRDKLRTTAIALLSMLSGAKAIALNRAAIEDKTRTLGPLLSQSGRSVVGPRLAKLMVGWRSSGAVAFADPKEATMLFVNLLVGDHQIQRVTGAAPALCHSDVEARVDRAMAYFEKIFAP